MLIPYKEICEKYKIRPTGVLHCGASIGQEMKDYFDNGVKSIIWVEANSEQIQPLLDNITPYLPETSQKIWNECLSDKDGEEVTFHISNNKDSSSFLDLDYHKIAHPEVDYVKNIILKTKRLDTLFRENELRIDDYPFINLDLQGAELLALKGLGELIRDVKYIYCEINVKHLYENCPLVEDVDNYLKEYGFERVETVMSGNHQWGDSLYLKKD